MNKLISTLVLALALGLVGAATLQSTATASAASQYATRLISSSLFDNDPEWPSQSGNANVVLGAPDAAGGNYAKAEDFYALNGEFGQVTVAWADGVKAIKGEGDDILVYLLDFSTLSNKINPATGQPYPEDETFTLEGSADGVTYVTLIPGSVSPAADRRNQNDVVGFNLPDNQAYVTHVRARNLRNNGGRHPGAEFDAFEARNHIVGDAPQCSDFKDNDGDGKIDYPADLGCESPTDNDEKDKTECSDGKDNDGDGKIDLDDPGCDNKDDDSEDSKPQCSDSKDNDDDGLTDENDPGCHDDQDLSKPYNPDDNSEDNGQCSDKKDNDKDGFTDKKDPDCHSDNDPNDGDDSFDGSRDEDTNNKKVVKAAVVKVAPAVPVTAKTGAGAVVSLTMTVLGASGLAITRRLFNK